MPEFTKSIKRHPTIGTTKYGVGRNPYRLVSSSIFAIAFGVAPIPNPQVAEANTAPS